VVSVMVVSVMVVSVAAVVSAEPPSPHAATTRANTAVIATHLSLFTVIASFRAGTVPAGVVSVESTAGQTPTDPTSVMKLFQSATSVAPATGAFQGRTNRATTRSGRCATSRSRLWGAASRYTSQSTFHLSSRMWTSRVGRR